MKDPVVYFVNTIRLNGDHRTVGYFRHLSQAELTVENNYGDIYEEGYYRYAMIEALSEGLYPIPNPSDGSHEHWYRWEGQRHTIKDVNGFFTYGDGGYKRCKRPEKYNRTVCWAVG